MTPAQLSLSEMIEEIEKLSKRVRSDNQLGGSFCEEIHALTDTVPRLVAALKLAIDGLQTHRPRMAVLADIARAVGLGER